MRTIKFRAWDDGKKEWLLGYEYPNLGGFSLDGECVLMGEWANVCTSFMFENNNHKRADLKLMQFIGLKDKNGKEIYEGDILKFENDLGRKHIYKIWMEEGGFVYNMFDNDIDKNINQIDFYYGCSDMQSKQWLKQCEVIGNIHENPELLSTPTAVL